MFPYQLLITFLQIFFLQSNSILQIWNWNHKLSFLKCVFINFLLCNIFSRTITTRRSLLLALTRSTTWTSPSTSTSPCPSLTSSRLQRWVMLVVVFFHCSCSDLSHRTKIKPYSLTNLTSWSIIICLVILYLYSYNTQVDHVYTLKYRLILEW